MRETKFKAILSDEQNKENAQILKWEDFENPLDFWKNYYAWQGNIKILLEWISLVDQNNIDIYEGDIVKIYSRAGEYIGTGTVKFKDTQFCVETQDGAVIDFFSMNVAEFKYEIVGNIYYNKDGEVNV